jgi:hypothetical protein
MQTSQTGGQRYSDASPFSIPCIDNVTGKWMKGEKKKRDLWIRNYKQKWRQRGSVS